MNQTTFSNTKDIGLAWVNCQVCYEDTTAHVEEGRDGEGVSEERILILDTFPSSKVRLHHMR